MQLTTITTVLSLLQYKLTVPKMGNVADLLDVLSKEANIPKDKVIGLFCTFVHTPICRDFPTS